MTGASGAAAAILRSASRTASGVGGVGRRAELAPAPRSAATRGRGRDCCPAASFARFLYWTKPHSSAMPHASSTTPPNDSSSLLRSDSDGAMLRTGTR